MTKLEIEPMKTFPAGPPVFGFPLLEGNERLYIKPDGYFAKHGQKLHRIVQMD
jgi:hypothetical protein